MSHKYKVAILVAVVEAISIHKVPVYGIKNI